MAIRKLELILIQKAKKLDREAFTELYLSNVDRVYRHVYYRVYNRTDAEDITQETFIRAWKAIGKYQYRGVSFCAWLIAISDNLVIDYFKAHKKSISLDNLPEDKNPYLKDKVEMNLDGSVIKEAIANLPEKKRKMVLMRYIEGYDYCEIARFFNKTEGAIRVTLHRALKELKGIIDRKKPE
jgi:RNA polymerase sigma-70 factor (ECF subfamily)